MKTTRVALLLSSIVAIAVCQFVILGQVQTSPNSAVVEIHGQVRFAEGGAPAGTVRAGDAVQPDSSAEYAACFGCRGDDLSGYSDVL